MRPFTCFTIVCVTALTPHLVHAEVEVAPDPDVPRLDMLGNPIDTSTTSDDRAPTSRVPDHMGPPAWPVPEIMRQAREREAHASKLDVQRAAASPGYTVPRTVSVTYTGDVPLAPDVAPHIAMAMTPATEGRIRLLAVGVDPIGLVNGHYGASIARRLGDHVALRADGQFTRAIENVPDSSTFRLGITLPLYLDQTFRGPFIEPGLAVARSNGGLGLTSGSPVAPPLLYAVHEYTAGPQIFVGWQWLFDNGLHIAGAIGASQDWTGSSQPAGIGVLGTAPVGGLAIGSVTSRPNTETYVRVGYAF